MRGFTTVEWLVIAAIVMLAVGYVINYWNDIWNPLEKKMQEKKGEFQSAIANLSPSPERCPPESSRATRCCQTARSPLLL